MRWYRTMRCASRLLAVVVPFQTLTYMSIIGEIFIGTFEVTSKNITCTGQTCGKWTKKWRSRGGGRADHWLIEWMIEFSHKLISKIQPVVRQVLRNTKENHTNKYSTYHDEEHAESKHHTHADIHSATTPCSFLPVPCSTKNNNWNQPVHSEEHTQQRK